ncbi:MAG: PAS domain S-box protein [Janthinobacterium lividum]
MTDDIPPPKADRTQLQQIIAGLNDGVILIDPDQTIAWANATALALHGVTRMEELGATVSEFRQRFELTYRNRHKLPEGEYPMERLLAGEAFSEVVVEVHQKSSNRCWVHSIRTLVLTDKDGQPDCLVLIINDETERFNAEERFERTFNANPAPAIIARLADMRYIKVNRGFLELTGLERDDLVGRSIHDFDVLNGAEQRELAVNRLHAGETIPQMEGCLALLNGRERTVLLGGQPIAIGDERCMLFTFADLHPRQQAQHALKHSEERFSKAFHMAPGPMAILALDGFCVADVNDAFTVVTGWSREEVLGREQAQLGLWGDAAACAAIERQILANCHLQQVDVRLGGKAGSIGDFQLSTETTEIQGVSCVLTLMHDVSEHRQTETELLAAVESVMQDTTWLSQRIVERLATVKGSGKTSASAPEVSSLPERLRGVLTLIAQGLSDDEIADKLSITRNTVRNHVSAIYGRLGIRKRSALVVWARERGLGASPKLRTMPNNPRPAKRH